MRTMLGTTLLAAILTVPVEGWGESTCATTIGSDLFGPALPTSKNWYGSEALAVQLPEGGVWPTTRPGALIAVKLFWWSAGFRPGMESNLNVSIRSLSGGSMTAVVSRATNARLEPRGTWTMLTGIDFPDSGCWEISGEYLGQRLIFVVETTAAERSANEADNSTSDYNGDAVDQFVRELRESNDRPPRPTGPANSIYDLINAAHRSLPKLGPAREEPTEECDEAN